MYVVMLNSALTVLEGKSNSHQKEWVKYTDEIIKIISERLDGIIFILWGRNAQDKIKLIDQEKHHIIKGVHPSPLSASRGFFGCKHFSRTNDYGSAWSWRIVPSQEETLKFCNYHQF